MADAERNRSSRAASSNRRMLKVVLLGDGRVGKSSLMNVYVTGKFAADSFHTIGVEFLIKELMVDGEKVALQIWDTAGQERYRSLRTPFYRGSDCCILTFAVDDLNSFNNLAMWQREFIYYADINGSGDIDSDVATASFPFVVIGNKVDNGTVRVVSTERAMEWCRQRGLPYYETSARDAINVDTAFEAVARRVQEIDNNLDMTSHGTRLDTVNLSAKRNIGHATPSAECC
jgi:small GTP-binding protein